VNPTRANRDVKHKFKPTPEEWVDRADLISKLVYHERTDREVKRVFDATPEEWVVRMHRMSLLVYPARATCYA
jgi:hypothetical protein